MNHFIRLILLLTTLLAMPVLAQGQLTLLVTDLPDEQKQFSAELKRVARNALSDLRSLTLSPLVTDIPPRSEEQVAKILQDAEALSLEQVAVVSLAFPKKGRAMVYLTFYNPTTKQIQLQRDLELKYETLPGLLAQLEYQLAKSVKQELNEIGSVIDQVDEQVYFDLGTGAGVKVGEVYKVYTVGQEILDSSGESYGYLDQQTGLIVVREVTSVYAIADVIIGRQTIKPQHYVEYLSSDASAFQGRIISKLDNEVAISFGANSGIASGAYFAVYKDLKAINEEDAFRELVAKIRINEVSEEYSVGEIARSDFYTLAKGLIAEGDYVEEIPANGKTAVLVGIWNPGLAAGTNFYHLSGTLESAASSSIFYRARMGFATNWDWYVSVGVMSALNHSERFYYGVDVNYQDDLATNLFVSVDIPTPLSRYVIINTELGYLVSTQLSASGLNVAVNAKLSLF